MPMGDFVPIKEHPTGTAPQWMLPRTVSRYVSEDHIPILFVVICCCVVVVCVVVVVLLPLSNFWIRSHVRTSCTRLFPSVVSKSKLAAFPCEYGALIANVSKTLGGTCPVFPLRVLLLLRTYRRRSLAIFSSL
jgi:hypothetical protein